LEVRNTYYVPVCPLGLLSPQHYRQQQNDHQGTYSVNFGDQVVFVWNNGLFKATMPLTTITNVGILRSAPGHNIYASFVEIGNQEYPTHFCSAVVTDDKADEFDAGDEATLSSTTNLEGDDEDTDVNSGSTPSAPHETTETEQPEAERPLVIPFDLSHDDSSTNVPSQDDSTVKPKFYTGITALDIYHSQTSTSWQLEGKSQSDSPLAEFRNANLRPSNQEAVVNQGTAQQDQNGYQTWRMRIP
jgi:hypothetical protein